MKSKHSTISVGDVVVVHDEHLSRDLWKLSKILSVMKGRDGLVRGATVRIGNKDGQNTLLNQPIQLLYPLEVQSREPVSEEYKENESPDAADKSGDVTGDSGASIPDCKSADGPTELVSSDVPRCFQPTAAQRADANRKACMLELETI